MNDLISREQLINKLNSTGTNITLDIPVEEILGENVDLDDFATLMLADQDKERCARENQMQFDFAKGYSMGVTNALEIVKEGDS